MKIVPLYVHVHIRSTCIILCVNVCKVLLNTHTGLCLKM